MDERKAVFPVFFRYTYQHLGEGTNIFHVLDIEKLDERRMSEFIRALQGGREMFRNAPYALVFWVTPEFEKRLSHLAPDFHHWVFHTFDFTDNVIPAGIARTQRQGRQSTTQRQEWQDATDRLPIENIRQYLKKALDQFHHWEAVKTRNEDFLIEPMGVTSFEIRGTSSHDQAWVPDGAHGRS